MSIVVSPSTSVIVAASNSAIAQVVISSPVYQPVFRSVQLKIFADSQIVVAGDNKFIMAVPSDFDGMRVIDIQIYVTTVSSSDPVGVQIRNITKSNQDMLTTIVTVDENEFTSFGAATSPVIDITKNNVSQGDLVAVDVDLAGTDAQGLGVLLRFI